MGKTRFFKWLLIACFIPMYTASGQTITQLEKKNGFRDARFGASVKSFRNLVLTEQEGNTKYYRRKTDVMTMKGVEFADITYAFYKDRLSHVFITLNGVENSREFVTLLESLYGEGERLYPWVESFDNVLEWNGENITLTYGEIANTKEGIVHYYSNTTKFN
ncbi:hypothetical protein [Adhaeribacter pallidiroseus]|uniref:Uncharacterized protein n=1 Tax=Adhaeribacter pallidiroseus TaxID=2072847 RepID=A0A369QKZ5_9BACT|nr:hypothetical protein [Adhaeribacter pallidiroseus]RDC63896.1 hypothetical protein AHMF7616_02505 [Adhaeribacter pallidiroseus]